MPDSLYEERLSLKFRCRRCQNFADMIEVDGALGYVRCIPCGIVEHRGQMMYRSLLLQHQKQTARDLIARQLRAAGSHRPLGYVVNEFSDPRWPFILVAEHDS